MTAVGTTAVAELRRAPLAALRGIDLRAAERDLWVDEAALWDRLVASWERSRGEPSEATLARYELGRGALLEAIGTIGIDELRSPDGWSWAYDCLHGHIRKHAAMLGPWCATAGWPDERG